MSWQFIVRVICLFYLCFDMFKYALDCSQNLRLGVFDVIPSNCLDGLTAEDLRLLLNGVGDINVQTLISYTSFNDECGRDGLFFSKSTCLQFFTLI